MSISLRQLVGYYAATDFGIVANSNDMGRRINEALAHIASTTEYGNSKLLFGPGTYTIRTSVVHPDNVTVEGVGGATIFRLGTDALVDVWTATDVSNMRLRNLRIDANRANNAAGTRNGLWLSGVSDAWLENVEVISARSDGFRLDDCERIELRGVRASDNGRHGISLSFSRFCQLIAPRSYDNSQVAVAGVGDGINLELLSGDNTIICPMCYETGGAGDKQGYGIREATGEGCYRNAVLGGAQTGNRTAAYSVESSDSPVFSAAGIRYQTSILTTI